MGGLGSTCYGSHDAQRDNDQSTTGRCDTNEIRDGGKRYRCVLRPGACLLQRGDAKNEALVARRPVGEGAVRR